MFAPSKATSRQYGEDFDAALSYLSALSLRLPEGEQLEIIAPLRALLKRRRRETRAWRKPALILTPTGGNFR